MRVPSTHPEGPMPVKNRQLSVQRGSTVPLKNHAQNIPITAVNAVDVRTPERIMGCRRPLFLIGVNTSGILHDEFAKRNLEDCIVQRKRRPWQ